MNSARTLSVCSPSAGTGTIAPRVDAWRSAGAGYDTGSARRADGHAAQMRMTRERGHIVDAGKGDIGSRELLHQRICVECALVIAGDLAIGLGGARRAQGWWQKRGSVPSGCRLRLSPANTRHSRSLCTAMRTTPPSRVGKAPAGNGGVGQPDALRRLAGFLLQQRHRHPVGHGVEHR